jgi:hypothetical protein
VNSLWAYRTCAMAWTRGVLLLLVLLASTAQGARFCYVGELDGRVWDAAQKAVECSAAIYGDNPACAVACGRDREAKTDVCSFSCIPGQHCSDSGLVHPVSEMSPGLYLPDCPMQQNFEAVEGQEDKLECVSRCCKDDRCNTNAASRTGAALNAVLTAGALSAMALTLASTRYV